MGLLKLLARLVLSTTKGATNETYCIECGSEVAGEPHEFHLRCPDCNRERLT